VEKASENEIKKIIKERKVLYGYKQAKKTLKSGNAESIIIANDMPLKKEFKEYKEFDGDSKQLGIICGKPFNISVLTVIKEK